MAIMKLAALAALQNIQNLMMVACLSAWLASRALIVIAQPFQEAGYLTGDVDFSQFRQDLIPDNKVVDRDKLIAILKRYFDVKGFSADWSHIEECEDERLVTTLSMICPFGSTEKQALLEAPDLVQRAQLLIAMLEMSVLSQSHDDEDSDVSTPNRAH